MATQKTFELLQFVAHREILDARPGDDMDGKPKNGRICPVCGKVFVRFFTGAAIIAGDHFEGIHDDCTLGHIVKEHAGRISRETGWGLFIPELDQMFTIVE